MKFFGQLESAQIENRTSDPTLGVTGRIWLRTDTNTLKIDDGSSIKDIRTGNVNLASQVTGTLPIVNGGTGQTTAAAAMTALSPLTTKGDLLGFSTLNARVPIGTDGQTLVADSTQSLGLKWDTPAGAPDQSYEFANGTLTATVASNALTIALKTKAGADASAGSPVKTGFRNATAATGTYSQVLVTGALSLVVSSGSTLGHRSATEHYIYVYLINNAGTAELACSSSLFDNGTIVSTTAEGGAGAADSNRVMYSTTARTNVACRLIGRLKSSQTTAGTWATAISEISLLPFDLGKPILIARRSGTVVGSGTSTLLVFTTVTSDTWNIYDETTGIAVAPMTGYYRVSGEIRTNQTTPASAAFRPYYGVVKYLAGAGTPLDFQYGAEKYTLHTTAASQDAAVSTILFMNAGDSFGIGYAQNSGNNLSPTNSNAEQVFAAEFLGRF